MNEKPTVGSPVFGAFPSDRNPKATKDVNVHLFIHNFTSCNNYCQRFSEFRELFEATSILLLSSQLQRHMWSLPK